MYESESLIIFLISAISTFFLTKKFIHRFHEGGHVVKDMYKLDKPEIPTMGGIAIIGGTMLSLIVAQILIPDKGFVVKLLIFYFTVYVFGMFGLLDDLIRIKSRLKRVYVLYFLALPIALLNIDTSLDISFLNIHWQLGWVYPYIVAPLYVMIVSNLINMHAGFNGLSGGLSWILLFFIGVMSYLKYGLKELPYIMAIMGGLSAFMWFNRYPSKIFLGNCGTQLLGAAVGGLLILYNLEFFGVIILVPHIINFLMWIYWLLNMKMYPHIKFAEVKKDGTIKPPNKFTMKYLVTDYFKLTEKKAICVLYCLSLFFCIIGLLTLQ